MAKHRTITACRFDPSGECSPDWCMEHGRSATAVDGCIASLRERLVELERALDTVIKRAGTSQSGLQRQLNKSERRLREAVSILNSFHRAWEQYGTGDESDERAFERAYHFVERDRKETKRAVSQ